MDEVRFDDLEGLRRYISDEFGPWGPELEVSQDLIDRFADLTGDRQWIHVDVERAKSGPFGTTIAHGLLTVALLPTFRAPAPVKPVGQSTYINYGAEGFRFLAPVPAGSKLHARIRLADVREHKAGTLLVHETAVHVVGQDRPSLLYTGLLLYAR